MGKNILITGATSGIGKALAISYNNDGNQVIALGRNLEVINDLKSIGIAGYAVDLTNLSELLEVSKLISLEYHHIDIAILNAGTCEYVDVKMFDAELVSRVISANIISFANTVQAVLPMLRLSIDKHLVGTASMAGYLPLPRAEAYGASKAAIQYFLESLAIDLADEGFTVTTINPGFVRTPLTNKNDFSMPFILEISDAVNIIKSGIENKSIEIHFPLKLSLLMKLFRFCPKFLWRKIARNFKKK